MTSLFVFTMKFCLPFSRLLYYSLICILAGNFYCLLKIQHIVLIGAGNVATHLGKALQRAGFSIDQVYSRTIKSAEELAHSLGCSATSHVEAIRDNADVYILSVSDDGLAPLVKKLRLGDGLIVHTSGSVSMDVLSPLSKTIGVLYPLQTFSKERETDLATVPFCIEANSPETLERIKTIAGMLSSDVRQVSSAQRKQLHLAAVFACNFPNYMYFIATEIVQEAGLNFDLLLPLIKETANKVNGLSPAAAQTGPALRDDKHVMEQHVKMLSQWPEYQDLYKQISLQISKLKSAKHE